jgi:hypothetical protein
LRYGGIHKKVGHDFFGETFRVLKEKEEKKYGEYRTRHFILKVCERGRHPSN